MGECQPEAQWKGFSGDNFTALVSNKSFATCRAMSSDLFTAQRYQIFVNEKAVSFTSKQKTTPERGKVILVAPSIKHILNWVAKVEQDPNVKELLIQDSKPAQLFERFCQEIPMIEAAGGIVMRDQAALCIKRFDKWDLPKGKIEPGEAPNEAALREVEEECGLGNLQIRQFLSCSYHTYQFQQQLVMKRTYWYLMVSGSTAELVPQIEEGITEVRWIEMEQWAAIIYPNTYGSVYRLLEMEVRPLVTAS